jgi:hypothetical protein
MADSKTKLDWTRLLGFEQIVDVRQSVAENRIGGKVGQKVGGKIGGKIGGKNF